MGIQQMGVQTHTLSLSSFEILGKHMVVGKRYSSASTVSTSSRLLLPLLLSSLPGSGVRGHLKKIRRVTKAHPLAKSARV